MIFKPINNYRIMRMSITTLTLIMSVLALFGCEKSDNGDKNVNEQVRAAMAAKYPNAFNVKWQNKGPYVVADFDIVLQPTSSAVNDAKAWFDNAGVWYMTETDIMYVSIPTAVSEAFKATEYASLPWKVDNEVDKIERQGAETVYVIEVEKKENGVETEMDLYFSESGVLVKKVVDSDKDYDYSDYIPAQMPQSVTNFINSNYPGAKIVDVDVENLVVEVEIIDATNVCREIYFSTVNGTDYTWVYTKTELRVSQLPEAVMQAINASEYASYRIDEVDFMQTPQGDFYQVELELGSSEVELHIKADGTILNR